MAYYEVGTFIKKMRRQRGLTQKELAEGIISEKSLSRIETKVQLPSKLTLDALMERLGLNAERYFSTFLCSEDYEILDMQNKLTDYIRLRDLERAGKLVAALDENPGFQEGLNRQFLLHAIVSIDTLSRQYSLNSLELLLQAIHITIPDFELSDIPGYLLTSLEIRLINMLAVAYARQGETEKAISILSALKQSMDSSYVNRKERAQNYPLVLYGLSKYLGLAKRFDEAIAICDEAVIICRENDNLLHLPKILFNKAYCLNQKGDTAPCRRLIHQAYWCCDMIGKFDDRDTIKEHAQRTMGITIDPQD